MKFIAIATTFLLIAFNSFSQQTDEQQSSIQEEYLAKSIRKKNTATVLLPVGAALIVTSVAIPKGKKSNPCIVFCYQNSAAKTGLSLVGGITVVAGVLFFDAARTNKRRAASLSLKLEDAIQLQKQNLAYTTFPALGIKVRL